MREIRPSGSEGGVTFKPPSLPLSRQRTGASRLAHGQMERHRRLAPVADLAVSPSIAMRKYRTFLLVPLGIAVFLVLAFALTNTPTEPAYKGKRLREWLADWRFNGGRIVLSEPSVQAVRAIGTNALPHLWAMLRSSNSPTKVKLAVLLVR